MNNPGTWTFTGSGMGFTPLTGPGGLLAAAVASEGGIDGGGSQPSQPAEEPDASKDLGDLDLVELVRDGDVTAFRGLVERYQGRVYALVYGMVRNREDARDLVQEAFVKAYRNLKGFRREASFHTWLYRIAMNVTIDHLRKVRRVQITEFDDRLDSGEAANDTWTADHLHRHPGRDLERQRLYQRIMQAMQKLTPQQRQVVLLREIEGLSYKEISDTMEIPEGTVMSRLFYARKKLQSLLKDEIA